MADAHKNFAYSTVATAPSPATSGTSLVVQLGAGANYPTPPFNATVWPVNSIPSNSNAEIVRVTAISTDTMTIARTQESTSARTIVVGDQISANITKKTFDDIEPFLNVSGMIQPYAGYTAPTNWLLCNGAAVSRTTYATLFALLNPSLGTATMTIATPAVVTLTAHGLKNGDTVFFTTTGALPTGVSANVNYYITRIDANTFNLSTSAAGVGAIFVNTSGTQSGTHTLWRSAYGVGDGSTTFNVPDMRGRVIAGVEDMGGVGSASRLTGFAFGPPTPLAIGGVGGVENHVLTSAQMPSHTHATINPASGFDGNILTGGSWQGAASLSQGGAAFRVATNPNTSSTGSDVAHNNVQPTILMNYIIKT